MKGKPKIIAQTPRFKPGEMTSLGCIVIREYEDEFVVHNVECDREDGGYLSYYWGHYFPKKDGRDDALRRAVRCFVDKAVRWYIPADRPFDRDNDFRERDIVADGLVVPEVCNATQQQLRDLASNLQALLWRCRESWTLEKEWDSGTLDAVAELMQRSGLMPRPISDEETSITD
jgi:hypothetical protein